MVWTAAGGKKVDVPLGPGGPAFTNDDNIRIELATFSVPPKKKELLYLFDVFFKKGVPPKRIIVDDVTEDPIHNLADETNPKLAPDHRWRYAFEYKPTSIDQVPWLNYEGNALRVYRFTITFADGRTKVYYQGSALPAFVKDYVKLRLGFEKAPQGP